MGFYKHVDMVLRNHPDMNEDQLKDLVLQIVRETPPHVEEIEGIEPDVGQEAFKVFYQDIKESYFKDQINGWQDVYYLRAR